jgi:hypothetical protein
MGKAECQHEITITILKNKINQMKNFRLSLSIMLCLLICLSINGISQGFLVSGKVIDAETKQPLQGASIFCVQTTFGTVANTEGGFALRLPTGGYELCISFNGYESIIQRISDLSDSLTEKTWELRLKQKSLEEVSIVFSSEVKDGWEKYGAFFVSQFLGTSENAKQCTISNPEALRFFYYRIVDNVGLGYNITYQLDSFIHEFKTGATETTGYPFFKNMEGTKNDSLRWAEQRSNAYYGSLLHFFRCYYDSTLNLNGYKIEMVDESTEKPFQVKNPYENNYYTKTENGLLELNFPSKLRVLYKDETPSSIYLKEKKLDASTPFQISILKFYNSIMIEENGYFYDQRDLFNSGYWDWERLGDMLPYDFDL